MQPKPESSAETKESPPPSEFKRGQIEGVVVRDLRQFVDGRGWLAELFRDDEVADEFRPAMAYVSTTLPGLQRGPHEHTEQADYFCFIGPSTFMLRLWDNRSASKTYGNVMTLFVGEENPKSVIIPAGIVHAYKNVSPAPGVVINFPNRLYKGAGRREVVDEIRHEDDPGTVFRLDD